MSRNRTVDSDRQFGVSAPGSTESGQLEIVAALVNAAIEQGYFMIAQWCTVSVKEFFVSVYAYAVTVHRFPRTVQEFFVTVYRFPGLVNLCTLPVYRCKVSVQRFTARV